MPDLTRAWCKQMLGERCKCTHGTKALVLVETTMTVYTFVIFVQMTLRPPTVYREDKNYASLLTVP